MANLKQLIVNGVSRFIDKVYMSDAAVNKLTIGTSPVNNEDAATKAYVDAHPDNFDLSDRMAKGSVPGAIIEGLIDDPYISNVASGYNSHAEGEDTNALGEGSHAEGFSTCASGEYSHSEGKGSLASGDQSHAEGYCTHATGGKSHTEGIDTNASGVASHAEGRSDTKFELGLTGAANTTTYVPDGTYGYHYAALRVGRYIEYEDDIYQITNVVDIPGQTIEITFDKTLNPTTGWNNKKINITPVTWASGVASHAEGVGNSASAKASHAEGFVTSASGEAAHSEGYWTEASGNYSHAEGNATIASGNNSHAEGCTTKASGYCSHAEGNYTFASGAASHTEGFNTTASGSYSHAEGQYSEASGHYSHAGGQSCYANANVSTAIGYGNIANRQSQLVFGECNIADGTTNLAPDNPAFRTGAHIEIVGNGTSNNDRSNARTLDWDGNECLAGSLTLGAGTANEATITAAQLGQLVAALPILSATGVSF